MICPLKDADGIANCVDPNQTTPLEAVRSGPTLFAQSCLSEDLGSLENQIRWVFDDDLRIILHSSPYKRTLRVLIGIASVKRF